MLYLFTTEPASSPQNVSVIVKSSTEIMVSWDEVPPIDQNGTITMYEVDYEPLETFGGQISRESVNTSNSSVTSIVLSGLEEYVDYNISVRAYTSEGAGPYSDPVTERTNEDGIKLYSICMNSLSLSVVFNHNRASFNPSECNSNC